jgi:glycerophosphoryl diester phosphodiesterase
VLFEGQLADPLKSALDVGARQLVVRGDLVSPSMMVEARKRDLQVVCWTINHPAHIRLLEAAGVDGMMSDYPDRLIAAQKKDDQKS